MRVADAGVVELRRVMRADNLASVLVDHLAAVQQPVAGGEHEHSDNLWGEVLLYQFRSITIYASKILYESWVQKKKISTEVELYFTHSRDGISICSPAVL